MIERPMEWDLWNRYDLILGMDEAGRGPMAGPLCVAGVILPRHYRNDLIDDSKRLSEKKRELLFHEIRRDALWYQIVMVPEAEIDEYNIYQADKRAMEAIAREAMCNYVLTDAMPIVTSHPVEAIVHGDHRAISIAAASILAKVARDDYMKTLDELYPGYGLGKNKGYPTREHKEALINKGILPVHRRTWKPVRDQLGAKEAQQQRLF